MNIKNCTLFLFSFFLFFTQIYLFSGLESQTAIVTSEKPVLVQQLTIGSTITGYDLQNHSYPEVMIKNITQHEDAPVMTIHTDNGVVIASPDQLFYEATSNTFVQAKQLTQGKTLVARDFKEVIINEITQEQKATCYEITLDAPHLFFASDFLVHNIAPAAALFPPMVKTATAVLGAALAIAYAGKNSKYFNDAVDLSNYIMAEGQWYVNSIRKENCRGVLPENHSVVISTMPSLPTYFGVKPEYNKYRNMLEHPRSYGPFYPAGSFDKHGDVECTLFILHFDGRNKLGEPTCNWQKLGSSKFRRHDSEVKMFVEEQDRKDLALLCEAVAQWNQNLVFDLFTTHYSVVEEANRLVRRYGTSCEKKLYDTLFGVHAVYQMAAKKIPPSLVLQMVKYGKRTQGLNPARIICQIPEENVVVVLDKGCGGKPINLSFANDMANLNQLPPTEEQRESQEKIDKVLQGAALDKETSSSTKIYVKRGDCNNAKQDFNDMGLTDVRQYPNGTIVGKLPDGTMINVRCKSEDGRPTVEIIKKRRIKIRYEG